MLIADDIASLRPEDLLHMIQCDKEKITKECIENGDDIDPENVWRGNHALRPYTEEQMIQRSEKNDRALLCALSQPGMIYVLSLITFIFRDFSSLG